MVLKGADSESFLKYQEQHPDSFINFGKPQVVEVSRNDTPKQKREVSFGGVSSPKTPCQPSKFSFMTYIRQIKEVKRKQDEEAKMGLSRKKVEDMREK